MLPSAVLQQRPEVTSEEWQFNKLKDFLSQHPQKNSTLSFAIRHDLGLGSKPNVFHIQFHFPGIKYLRKCNYA